MDRKLAPSVGSTSLQSNSSSSSQPSPLPPLPLSLTLSLSASNNDAADADVSEQRLSEIWCMDRILGVAAELNHPIELLRSVATAALECAMEDTDTVHDQFVRYGLKGIVEAPHPDFVRYVVLYCLLSSPRLRSQIYRFSHARRTDALVKHVRMVLSQLLSGDREKTNRLGIAGILGLVLSVREWWWMQ